VSRWTLPSVASRAREVLRDEGARSLWFKVLGETVYRRMLVTELRLPAPPLAQTPRDGLAGRLLTLDDLDAYAALHGHADDAAARMRRGERCFGTWSDGRLVSTRWLATGTVRIEPLGRTVALAPGDVYIYGVFTAHEHRGRGVSVVGATVVPSLLAAEGAQRIVGVLEPESRTAVQLNKRSGYEIVGTIGYVRVGPFRRHFGRL
jgi:hypothetical protein